MDSRGIPYDSVLTCSRDAMPNESLISLHFALQGMPIPVCWWWRWSMKSKLSACVVKHEAFCLALLAGNTAADAARKAGYGRKNINARIVAWELLQREDIQARLKDLAEATNNEAVMTIIQRKVRLSDLARDPDSEIDPIRCIEELNKMDGLYRQKGEVAAPGSSSTVVVVENTRTKLTAIMNKLPVRIAEAKDVPLLEEGKQEETSG